MQKTPLPENTFVLASQVGSPTVINVPIASRLGNLTIVYLSCPCLLSEGAASVRGKGEIESRAEPWPSSDANPDFGGGARGGGSSSSVLAGRCSAGLGVKAHTQMAATTAPVQIAVTTAVRIKRAQEGLPPPVIITLLLR